MQDSLEDYVRISKNKNEEAPTIKKEVLVTAFRKRECERNALKVVEFFLNGRLKPEAFIKFLPHINKSYYQDIVEERAITKLCGYPVCGKNIPVMPKKQFHISTKTNKVYDITERKNFCSNYCYQASAHIKNQIEDSPLWLRDHEKEIQFMLLDKTSKCIPGEEIIQGITKADIEPSFTSVTAFTEVSLDMLEKIEKDPKKEKSSKAVNRKKAQLSQRNAHITKPMKTIDEIDENTPEPDVDLCMRMHEMLTIKEEDPQDVESNENMPKPIPVRVRPKKKVGAKKFGGFSHSDVEPLLEKCFKEWFTLDTLIFIHGGETVKATLDERKLGDYFESLKIADLELEQQQKYMDICMRLHLRELAEEKFDNAVVGSKTTLKPPPDFRKLKEDGKELDLKVKSFYSGVLHTQENSNFPTKDKPRDTNENEDPPVVLPLTTGNSQNALRRKVFLNSLNKSLDQVLHALRLSTSIYGSEAQALVKTFQLKADNVMFKPICWSFIAVVFLKILALKNEELRILLEASDSMEYLELVLGSLPKRGAFISGVLEIINNVDNFIEYYVTCK